MTPITALPTELAAMRGSLRRHPLTCRGEVSTAAEWIVERLRHGGRVTRASREAVPTATRGCTSLSRAIGVWPRRCGPAQQTGIPAARGWCGLAADDCANGCAAQMNGDALPTT